MPYYEVSHSYPLTGAQKQDLARALTHSHIKAFNTPSMFVNVRFIKEDPSQENIFVGGELENKTYNGIVGYVRTSAARTKADFDRLAAEFEEAWYAVVGSGTADKGKHPYLTQDAEVRLHVIGLLPIVTAREAGFDIPVAGEEAPWVREKLPAFKELAEDGHPGFVKLLSEVKAVTGGASV
ncbi:Tautomerase [Cordyceps fumosorosea ARSEF 2679]|uniref:Tautomerase n=1 Tax=Cordyceps fumosorosea (strain ARSEF 2679) TaxID=1081104 RepID=A0A167I8R9_CORFA|nr:Tautomerase [Cordyceps fumosorosea ARSEF 2679]OAA48797.1 Tautomerase [Cordyceps fumosorosea ARSEF 2679]